jgi:two-component system, OmpR family, response regulator
VATIVLVEDDELIRENFSDLLTEEGFVVESFSNSATALQRFNAPLPDMAILDISLGKETDAGFHLCTFLRQKSATIPIIFFSSHDSDFDKISGMRLGVDDYITKDVSMEYLIVRIKALLRRRIALSNATSEPSSAMVRGDLTLNMDSLTARWKGIPLEISLTQLWMLHALASHPGHVKRHGQLMDAANIVVEPNTVTAHIKNIREQFRQIDPSFSAIRTERGIGYRWVND